MPRPDETEVAGGPVHHRPRIQQQPIVACVRACYAARAGLGIQHVAQPYQLSEGGIEVVAELEGRGDVQRIAKGRDDDRAGTESPDGLEPELHQSAHPGVLQNEQPAVAELLSKQLLGAFPVHAGNQRGIPAGIEGPPVLLEGTRGSEDLLVQVRDRLRLPEPRCVVGPGAHQGPGQVAARDVQDPGQRRGAAAMHAGHQNGDLLRAAALHLPCHMFPVAPCAITRPRPSCTAREKLQVPSPRAGFMRSPRADTGTRLAEGDDLASRAERGMCSRTCRMSSALLSPSARVDRCPSAPRESVPSRLRASVRGRCPGRGGAKGRVRGRIGPGLSSSCPARSPRGARR